MEINMRIIMAILFLAVLMWVETAHAQSTYSVSVSRHSATDPLSDEDVRSILDKASKMLQKSGHVDSPDNVKCDVSFTLKGSVRTFGSSDTPVEVDMPNLDAVHRVDNDVADVDFHVKVVDKIKTFCRFPNRTGFQGCSFPPNFRSIIVVHPKKHLDASDNHLENFPDHVLWAHEFGHLTGLGHSRDGNALMANCPLQKFTGVPPNQVRVSPDECRCLRSGPGFGPNGICALPGPVPSSC
jgi:hypothetical protein